MFGHNNFNRCFFFKEIRKSSILDPPAVKMESSCKSFRNFKVLTLVDRICNGIIGNQLLIEYYTHALISKKTRNRNINTLS